MQVYVNGFPFGSFCTVLPENKSRINATVRGNLSNKEHFLPGNAIVNQMHSQRLSIHLIPESGTIVLQAPPESSLNRCRDVLEMWELPFRNLG